MRRWLVVGLSAAAALTGLMMIAGDGDEGHASSNRSIISIFGVKDRQEGNLLVHISLLVPSAANEEVAAAAALQAQGARPATPADLRSADFSTTGLVWDQFSDAVPGNDFVTQYYNNSNEALDGQAALTNTQFTWSSVPTSSFVLSFGGLTDRCPSLVDECGGPQNFDGFNDVIFLSLQGPCNDILGCTLGVTWFSTEIDEADMALNTKANWVHDCGYSGSAIEAESVILHENGHVVGLGHSADLNAVMAAFYSGTQCQLGQDDIDGISNLYPAPAVTPTATPIPTPTPSPTPTPTPTATPTPPPTPAPTPTPPSAGDDDGDDVDNIVEYECGSEYSDPDSVPERVDGAFFGIDDDGNDGPDEALPSGASAFDCDGDGYTGAEEDHVYSYIGQLDGDQKTCQEYDTNFTAVDPLQTAATPSLRWPSDFNSSASPLDSFNRLNILDIVSFLAPVKYLGTNLGTNPGDVRWDLTPGKGVFVTDINVQDITAMIAGSSGSPPMLGGAKALFGPACPWAP